MDKSSMSRVLTGMERKGLVERRPAPMDGRRRTVRTTVAADAVKERSRAVTLEVLDLAQREVRPEDRATCLRVLDTAKRTLESLDE